MPLPTAARRNVPSALYMQQAESKWAAGQVLLVNKPYQWTSFDVVRKIRHLTKTKKVGHAGTLDPLATGLLIVCTGRFTKNISEYMAQEKEYTGVFTLGARTPTHDLESAPEDFKSFAHITPAQLSDATQQFTGAILQVPPAHSAIKQGGKRVYELARRGEEVVLPPRPVAISRFTIECVELPQVFFRVVCSTGTYIRSLAADFGAALGCGAYLSALCRTRIGTFLNTHAYSMAQWEDIITSESEGIRNA